MLRLASLVLSLLFITPSAFATTEQQARACFDRALSDAKAGLTFAAMVNKYLDISALARGAALYTPARSYTKLSPEEQKRLTALVRQELAEVTRFRRVNLDSVKVRRGGKKVGSTFQLNGTFKVSDKTDSFSFLVTASCRFVDGVWNGVAFSQYVGEKF